MDAEELLPAHILDRALLSGNEYAWPPSEIPNAIEAARDANLVSLGGQLQFRFPNGATCECCWVVVDTSTALEHDLTWQGRVDRTANAALSEFEAIRAEYDFIAEGRDAFGKYLADFEAGGGDLNDAMYFVWYVETERGLAELEQAFPSRSSSLLARVLQIFRPKAVRN